MTFSKVQLVLKSADPMAEVQLIDHRFNPVQRGTGQIEVEVEPGLYLARASLGNRFTEQPVSVPDDQPDARVELPVIEFDSPIPLQKTRTTHEYHQHPVSVALTALLAGHEGNEGGFLFCVRDAEAAPREVPQAYVQAFQGFRLLDSQGQVRLDLAPTAETFNLQDRLLLQQARLPAGHYQLEWRQGPSMRLPVIIQSGLTTQWYALVQNDAGTPPQWRPDMAEAAVAYSGARNANRPDNPEFRLAERARYCLTRGINLLVDTEMGRMLRARFDNPMLGLLAAHLLLREQPPRLDLIEQVLVNTQKLLGADFPDVFALQLKFASMTHDDGRRRHSDLRPVEYPPLLRQSWDYLLEAAAANPDLIPTDSVAARISPALVNCGIWLAWRAEKQPIDVASPSAQSQREKTDYPVKDLLVATARLRAHPRNLPWGEITTTGLDLVCSQSNCSPDHPINDLPHAGRGPADFPDLGELFSQDHDQALATALDAAEQARELILHLVRLLPWDEIIRRIRRREFDGLPIETFSELQTALLPALQAARRHLQEDGSLDRRFVEHLARSLMIPIPVLRDNLLSLTKRATNLLATESRPETEQTVLGTTTRSAES